MIAHFQAPDGGFFDTSDDHESLITRPRDLQDNATPSGNAMTVTTLLKLAGFTNDLRYVDISQQALGQMQPMISQYPLGFGQWLQALSYTLAKPKEIAIVGDPDSADTQALLRIARDGYRPFQVIALGAQDTQPAAIPLLQDRGLVKGRAAAYVCRDFTCQAPTTEPEVLQTQLARRLRIVSEAVSSQMIIGPNDPPVLACGQCGQPLDVPALTVHRPDDGYISARSHRIRFGSKSSRSSTYWPTTPADRPVNAGKSANGIFWAKSRTF